MKANHSKVTGLAIEIIDLRRTYKSVNQEIHALRGVNLAISVGQFVALKGRSGSGKTTLLNCIGGLDQATGGVVRIFGDEFGKWTDTKRTAWRRQEVGFIFQSLGLLPVLSAYENVELVLRLNHVGARERREMTIEALNMVGLSKWMDHRPYELSGGQQQRVAIARALANRPRLIIADEPTGDLDSKTGAEILGLFQRIIRERNVTMLMATHGILGDQYVDLVYHIKDGVIGEVEKMSQ